MRLMPCPVCGRHVRVADRDCRFCGVAVTAAAPSLLSVALLGLALAGCDSGKPEPAKPAAPSVDKAEPTKLETVPVEVHTETTTGPVEPSSTTGEPSTTGGETGGAQLDDPIAEDPPPSKPKYGAPRPAKKYGAPPKPSPDEL